MVKYISIVVYLNMLITLPIHGWLGYQKINNLSYFWSFILPSSESSKWNLELDLLDIFQGELVFSLLLITILYLWYYLVDTCSVAHLYFRVVHHENSAKRGYYIFLAILQFALLPFLLAEGILAAIYGGFSPQDVVSFVIILVWKLFFIAYIGCFFDPERAFKTKLSTRIGSWPKQMGYNLAVAVAGTKRSKSSAMSSMKLVPSSEGSVTTFENPTNI